MRSEASTFTIGDVPKMKSTMAAVIELEMVVQSVVPVPCASHTAVMIASTRPTIATTTAPTMVKANTVSNAMYARSANRPASAVSNSALNAVTSPWSIL